MNELTSSGQNNLNNMRPMLGGFQIGLPGLQAAANFANANGYIQEVTNPQQVCTQCFVWHYEYVRLKLGGWDIGI